MQSIFTDERLQLFVRDNLEEQEDRTTYFQAKHGISIALPRAYCCRQAPIIEDVATNICILPKLFP